MKTLAILAVILGILFLYFVVNAEKSFIVGGNSNEVVPGGINISNIPKLIFDKTTQVLGNNVIGDSGPAFINNIIADVKNLTSKAVDKISETVKGPIENKINEFLCPTK